MALENRPRPAGNRWVQVPKPLPYPEWRLICLPHAGSGASAYFSWAAPLAAAAIEVRSAQYPGREARFAEPSIPDCRTLARALADAWPQLSGAQSEADTTGGGIRYALYGHSMGALVGFELLAELERRGATNRPELAIFSAMNPPHIPSRTPPLHQLPPYQMLRGLAERYGNIPGEVLDHPELAELAAPMIRADFSLVLNYRWSDSGPVAAPLTILGGQDDIETSEAELKQWQQHTRSACRVQMFPGGHFFNQTLRSEVLALIRTELGC